MPATKEDISSKLNEIVDLFDRITIVGNKAQRKAAFQPVEYRIQHLEFLISDVMPHMLENARRIKTHYGAAIGIEPTNGHSCEQHMQWADRAIIRIRMELKKVENCL